MRERRTEPDRRPPHDNARHNRTAVVTVLLFCAVALLLAASLPATLALSKILTYTGAAVAAVAILRGERLFAGHLTHWDQAAALVALGLLVGSVTNPAAVRDHANGVSADVMPENAPARVDDGAGDRDWLAM